MSRLLQRATLVALIVATSGTRWACAQPVLQTLAMVGDPAPGIPGGAFSSLASAGPRISPTGKVVFFASYVAPGGQAGAGFWLWDQGTITLLGLVNALMNGEPVTYISRRGGVRDDGAMYVRAFFSNAPADRDSGVVLLTPGEDMILVREGDAAPGTNGAVFDDFPDNPNSALTEVSHPTATALGVYSALRGGDTHDLNNTGIWTGTPGNLSLFAREGQQAPAFPPSSVIVPDSIVMNNAGQWLMHGMVRMPGNEETREAYFRGHGTSIEAVISTTDQAPGFPSGVAIRRLVHSAKMNASGSVAIWGGTSVDPNVVWAGPLDNLRKVLMLGLPIDSGCFCIPRGYYGRSWISESGTTALFAYLEPVGEAMVVADQAGVTVAVHSGQMIQGFSMPRTVYAFPSPSLRPPLVDAQNHAVCSVLAQSPGGSPDLVVVVWDRINGLQKVIASQEQVTLRPGVVWTVYSHVLASSIADDGHVPILIQRSAPVEHAVVLATFQPVPHFCDPIDFVADGFYPDTDDLAAYLAVFAGGTCPSIVGCNDIDFNNDSLYPDVADIEAFLRVFSGGPCML